MILPLLWVFLIQSSCVNCFKGENALRLELIAKANNKVPPFEYQENKTMEVGFLVRRIKDLDFSQNTLTMESSFYMFWQDSRLTWRGNGPYFSIAKKYMWMPRYKIYNSARDEIVSLNTYNFLLQTGRIYSSSLTWTNTVCIPSIRYFPFDEHACKIVLGFMNTQDVGTDIFYNTDSIHAYWDSYLKGNPRWEIRSFTSKTEMYKEFADVQYPVRVYTIVILRTGPQLALVTMCPALMCAFIGLLPFLVPPNSGTLIRLGLIASGMVVSYQIVDTTRSLVPSNGPESPLLVNFAMTCYVLLLLSFSHTVVMAFMTKTKKPPPSYVKSLLQMEPSKWILNHWFDRDSVDAKEQKEAEDTNHLCIWETMALLLDFLAFSLYIISWICLSINVSAVL